MKTHHIGFKVPDMGTFEEILSCLGELGSVPKRADVASHKRAYVVLKDGCGNDTDILLEIQCFEDGNWGMHFDVVSDEPMADANELAQLVGTGVHRFEGEPQCNVSIVPGTLGMSVSVMFRGLTAANWKPE